MTTAPTLRRPFREDAYLSSTSRADMCSVRRLLNVGWEPGVSTAVSEAGPSMQSDAVSRRFHDLATIWREECAHLASVREMVLHPAYQQVVGMGPSALPLILAELEREPEHWFWALRAITGENPVPSQHQGNVAEMARDWLNWAAKTGVCRWTGI